MSKEDQFIFSYSAKQQDEIKYIRDKYLGKNDKGINRIREIDRSIERKASFYSVLMGVVGILTFGGGLSMIMTQEGLYFMVTGSILSLSGILLSGFAYPAYPRILRRLRKHYAPLIIKMCNELLEEQGK